MKNSIPNVSVIIPAFNAEKYIGQCLDSVINQNYDDWELIVVNDGSTDNTENLCLEYMEKDSRVQLVNQNNSGPDMARKNGLYRSKGEYILFVDADDYISSDYVSAMMRYAVDSDVDIVCSQIIRFNEAGNEWPGSKVPEELMNLQDADSIMKAYFVDEYLMGTYYAKLIKREIIMSYGFVKDSVIGEDISAALYMFSKAKHVCIIPYAGYHYYYNARSISHSGYTYRHKVSLKNYIEVRDRQLSKQLDIDKSIIYGYFAEYEMAVATAMSRNWQYDKEAGLLLRSDIINNWKYIKSNKKTPFYMKVCMSIYICSPHLFMALYRVIYLVTGR